MKSLAKINPIVEISKYPYLGKCKNTDKIILFYASGSGIVLVGDKIHSIGNISLAWAETISFDKIETEVTIIFNP